MPAPAPVPWPPRAWGPRARADVWSGGERQRRPSREYFSREKTPGLALPRLVVAVALVGWLTGAVTPVAVDAARPAAYDWCYNDCGPEAPCERECEADGGGVTTCGAYDGGAANAAAEPVAIDQCNPTEQNNYCCPQGTFGVSICYGSSGICCQSEEPDEFGMASFAGPTNGCSNLNTFLQFQAAAENYCGNIDYFFSPCAEGQEYRPVTQYWSSGVDECQQYCACFDILP